MLAVMLSLTLVAPAAAGATESESSQPTLAEILLADSGRDNANGFDRRSGDFDIVTQLVLQYPDLVAAASNADADLTVFLPNDRAFRRLVHDITGKRIRSEQRIYNTVMSLGEETVLSVLQYHIVPARISYRDALAADGAMLPTLLPEATVEVDVRRFFRFRFVKLIDNDPNDRDAYVIRRNVGGEAANGYAHGISQVLRPVDL